MKKLLLIIVLSFYLATCTNVKEAEDLFNRAILLWEKMEYDEAIEHFITLTKLHPSSHLVDDSLYFIANIYHIHLNENKQAIRYYRYLNKRFSDSEFYADSLKNLASLHVHNKDDIDKAIRIYRTIQEEFPAGENFVENQIEIAKLMIRKNDFGIARAELKKLIENDQSKQNKAIAYSLIGFSYYQEGKIELARLAYQAAQQFDKVGQTKWYSAINLAGIYEEEGDLKQSLDTFENLLSKVEQDELMYILVQKRIKKIQSRLSKI